VADGSPPARALPQIYTPSSGTYPNGPNASQWQQLSLYAYLNHGAKIVFIGTMTQFGACDRTPIPFGCEGADNRLIDGWRQLYQELATDARTQQALLNATDIK
jgi:hypothetical protein